MTRDDIIRMARDAGFESHDAIINYPKELQRFAAIVAAAEREACAQVCDKEAKREELADDGTLGARYGAYCCAIAIRERGAP